MISGPALATTMTPRPVRGHLTGYPGLDPPVSWGTDRSPQQPVCGPVLPPPGTRRGKAVAVVVSDSRPAWRRAPGCTGGGASAPSPERRTGR